MIDTKTNRELFIAKAAAWQKADPLFTVQDIMGATAVFSGSSTDTFNVLALEPNAKRSTVETVDHARRSVFGADNRFAIWSWEEGQLDDLTPLLGAAEENLVMSATLESRVPQKPKIALTVTHATSSAHLAAAGTVLAEIFGENEEGFMVQSIYMAQEEAAVKNLPLQYLVAYEDGGPIATGSFLLTGDTASIFDVAVRPSLQGKGIGSAMFEAVFDAATDAGAKNFTLQATADGAGIYERAGFKKLGSCWCLDFAEPQ